MRGLAFADLHIGQGASIGLTAGERVAEQVAAVRRALEQSRRLGCSFVLFAGDAWERRSPSPDEIIALELVLLEHRDEDGPPIYAIPGNHDIANTDAGAAIDVLGNVGLLNVYREPTTVVLQGGPDPVVLCVIPWVSVHRLVAHAGGGHRDELNTVAAAHIESIARSLYAEAKGLGAVSTILMTHFSVSTATTATGADVGVFREPVLSVAELDAIGFDAIVLGHIHKQQDLTATAFYCGSLSALNFGETDRHGFVHLDIGDTGVIETTRVVDEHSREFATLDVDMTAVAIDDVAPQLEELIERLEPREERPRPFVKLRYRCTPEQAVELDNKAIRDELEARFAHRAWVVPVVEKAATIKQEIAEDGSDADALAAYLLGADDVDPDMVARLLDLGNDYLERARS